MQRISILGSTGSVGQSTLEVVALYPELFSIVALTANKNVEKMFAQCQQFQPELVVMADVKSASVLSTKLAGIGLDKINVLSGAQSICDVAFDASSDTVMSAIVGAAGLLPTLLCAGLALLVR